MKNVSFARAFDALLAESVGELVRLVESGSLPEARETLVASETMGHVIEKLLILNIRYWHLEDLSGSLAPDDPRYAEVKRKAEHLFAVERPRLIAALNLMLRGAVANGGADFLADHNTKLYKGY
jgi:hypothetical protein